MVGGERKRGPIFESADVPDNAYGDGMVADKTIEDLKRMKESDKYPFLPSYSVSPFFSRPFPPINN